MKLFRWVLIGLVVVLAIAAIVFFGIVPGQVARSMNVVINEPPYTISEKAQALHESLVVADLHADSLLWDRDLLERGSYGHVDLPRLQEANMAIQAFTVVTKVPPNLNIESNPSDEDQITLLAVGQLWPVAAWTSLTERALYQAQRLHRFAEQSNGQLIILKTRSDVTEFLASRGENPNRVAGFLGIEGAHALEGGLENLDRLFDAGFRMMGPTHFFDNAMGGSAHGETKGGLTDFGREVITRMEELGMLVDLAHASPAMIDDLLEMATRPPVVSHTGVKGVCDNARNLTDEHLRHIAELGGVVGIGFWDTAVCGESVDAIVEAIRYTSDLIGPEHVALGSDFDGAIPAIVDVTGVPLVTQGLLEAGLPEDDIAKIMGGNVARLLSEYFPET